MITGECQTGDVAGDVAGERCRLRHSSAVFGREREKAVVQRDVDAAAELPPDQDERSDERRQRKPRASPANARPVELGEAGLQVAERERHPEEQLEDDSARLAGVVPAGVRCETPCASLRRRRRPVQGEYSSDIFRTLAAGKVTSAGRYRFVERALSRNTHPSPTAAHDPVSVRTLAGPTRGEIEALAEIFDQYRAHYGEDSDATRAARWLDKNLSTGRLRVFVGEDNRRFVGFAITMEVPGSLRLAHYWQIRDLFVLPTHRRLGVGRALLASVRAAAIASGALRLVVQTEDDNHPALRLYADSGYAPIKGYRSLVLSLGPEPR